MRKRKVEMINTWHMSLTFLTVLDLPVVFWSCMYVSHKTNMFLPRRKGSLKMATGYRYTSESCPSAWPVLDPSKFQIGRSAMKAQDDEMTNAHDVTYYYWSKLEFQYFLMVPTHCELYLYNIDKLDIPKEMNLNGYLHQQNTVIICLNCQDRIVPR